MTSSGNVSQASVPQYDGSMTAAYAYAWHYICGTAYARHCICAALLSQARFYSIDPSTYMSQAHS